MSKARPELSPSAFGHDPAPSLPLHDLRFTHHAWYVALDLDELDEVGRRLRLLSVNRRNFLELRDADHLERDHEGLRAAVSARLRANNLDPALTRVTLIAYPRVLGYVFNPVSFYLCHDLAGVLRLVLTEVHNTHGDREVYAFSPLDEGGPVFRGVADKRMYVSPSLVPRHATSSSCTRTTSTSRSRFAKAKGTTPRCSRASTCAAARSLMGTCSGCWRATRWSH